MCIFLIFESFRGPKRPKTQFFGSKLMPSLVKKHCELIQGIFVSAEGKIPMDGAETGRGGGSAARLRKGLHPGQAC